MMQHGMTEMGIIQHNYVDASDDLAQWMADQYGRQEVTPEWFWKHGIELDLPFFFWVRERSEDRFDFGMDPWIIGTDFGYQMNSTRRVFVQKKDLVRHGF